jgi:GH15 family glucan-1,4-alpha-glucosidase
MAYQPIEDYGVIGNMRTVALVGKNGSIDWYCVPHVDSPSVFGAILDDRRGGRFSICPEADGVATKQLYWPDTNILVTRFLSPDGVGEIQDFMPVSRQHQRVTDWLVRRVRVVRGSLTFTMRCQPAFDYGGASHEVMDESWGVRFVSPDLTMALVSSVPLRRAPGAGAGADGGGGPADGGVTATFTLRENETASFLLHKLDEDEGSGYAVSPEHMEELFQETVGYWNRWLARCTYRGRWREIVHRSALTLKLLTFEPTGAIVAAPTCSLPEYLGGPRNWDYRYTWLRDAAFTIYGLLRIGLTEEATGFMQWIDARCAEADTTQGLQIMYGIDGRTDLTETLLDRFEGYKGSGPVRIGNQAHAQLQLDTYGELLDSVYLYNKHVTPISYDTWQHLRDLLHYVCDHWEEPDEGIWEVRSGRRHFVSSKLMCWVAVDRGIRLAQKRSFPGDRLRWIQTRDALYEQIMARGWNAKLQAFVQTLDGDALDASTLLMPLLFFVAPGDPRMLSTLEAIRKPMTEGGLLSDSLVYRYNNRRVLDGVGGDEGTFNMCTFWLVEALTRAGSVRPELLADARLLFERMLGYANHLGLFAEQTGPRGEALGNFPQAFTHLALISAAFNLDRALGRERGA